MTRLLAALERIATALEQLVPALIQATREARRVEPPHLELPVRVEPRVRGRHEAPIAYRIPRTTATTQVFTWGDSQ